MGIKKAKILDCTLRDGGYLNNWNFNNEFVQNYLRIMKQLNIEYVEIGFVNKDIKYRNNLVGKYRYLTNKNIEDISKELGQKVVVMVDFKELDMNRIQQLPKEYIKLLRIAFHKQDLKYAVDIGNQIEQLGIKVSLNAMATCNYSDDELEFLINNANVEYLYIADSYGSLLKNQLNNIFNKINKSNQKLGLHLHNNMQNALYNALEMDNKVELIDTTIYGMGRGAGNLQFENYLLQIKGYKSFNQLKDLFIFIVENVKNIYGIQFNKWGYDLDFLISGHLNIHPNYIVKMRDNGFILKDILIKLLNLKDHKILRYFSIEKYEKLVN